MTIPIALSIEETLSRRSAASSTESTLFKERTGEKFVDYLNRVRIEKSVELLTTTNMKMYQIAKNVGYDNVKYFFKIFKKVMGVTPEAYREAHSV